jgi:pimeloyl-ACP methyl ester carboxylesterase
VLGVPVPDVHPISGRDVVVPGRAGGAALRMHVVEHGRAGGGLPVVLLHGLPATSYLWRDVARDLEHERLCVMPDLLGCGESERPADRGAYRLEEQAATLLRLLDALGIDRFAVVGNDLGGAVAVHVAALAGARVAGLVLSGAPVHAEAWPTPPALPLLPRGVGEALVAVLRSRPALARRVLARALGTALSDRELDHYVGPLLSAEGAAALLRLVRSVDLAPVQDAWRLLCASPPPVLVLWGADDRLRSPAYGRRLAAEAPGAVWAPVADAGHLLPAERPERFAEELSGFLADL